MKIKCKVCQKPIKVKPSLISRKKYCSKKCLYIGRPKKERKVVKCVCKHCDKEFNGIPSEVSRGKSIFCSKKCWLDWRKKQRIVFCLKCGKKFERNTAKRKFCSYDCWLTHYRDEGFKKNIGKKYKLRGGYVGIKTKENKVVYEHRFVWENHNSKIPDGYIVHHLNGIKNDNRIENLMAIPRNEHLDAHHFKKRIQIYEEHIKRLENDIYDLKKELKNY